jgi:hypothetical protein
MHALYTWHVLHAAGDVSRRACLTILSRRKSIAIVIGGGSESLLSRPGTNDLVLKRRQGFVKIALRVRCPFLLSTLSLGKTACTALCPMHIHAISVACSNHASNSSRAHGGLGRFGVAALLYKEYMQQLGGVEGWMLPWEGNRKVICRRGCTREHELPAASAVWGAVWGAVGSRTAPAQLPRFGYTSGAAGGAAVCSRPPSTFLWGRLLLSNQKAQPQLQYLVACRAAPAWCRCTHLARQAPIPPLAASRGTLRCAACRREC